MADITDVEAVNFCNVEIRPQADSLASLYYECAHLKNLKEADGDTATTISLREGHIRSVADMMLNAIQKGEFIENIWFNVGTGSTISSKIPNDTSPIIDGAPEDGRPPIIGQDVHILVSHTMDIDKWLADAAFGGPGTGTSQEAMYNTMVVCGSSGNDPLTVSQVNTFIDNRCGEIITEYEASSNLKLTQVLAVSPNPRNPVA